MNLSYESDEEEVISKIALMEEQGEERAAAKVW